MKIRNSGLFPPVSSKYNLQTLKQGEIFVRSFHPQGIFKITINLILESVKLNWHLWSSSRNAIDLSGTTIQKQNQKRKTANQQDQNKPQ